MCTDENNDQNKAKSPLPRLFHSSYRFRNCRKSTKLMNLKCFDFQYIFINCFVKN